MRSSTDVTRRPPKPTEPADEAQPSRDVDTSLLASAPAAVSASSALLLSATVTSSSGSRRGARVPADEMKRQIEERYGTPASAQSQIEKVTKVTQSVCVCVRVYGVTLWHSQKSSNA
jgi:hypothetical protein